MKSTKKKILLVFNNCSTNDYHFISKELEKKLKVNLNA